MTQDAALQDRIALPADSRAWIEIDLDALRSNLSALRALAGPEVEALAVVKADAYGHGMLPVSRALHAAGAHWLGVATVAEGIALREAGQESPILLICAPSPSEAAALISYRLTPMIGDPATLRAVADAAPFGYEIHLEVDTGIGRAGALPEQAAVLYRQAVSSGLRVTGLATHFSSADNPDSPLNCAQENAFAAVRAILENLGARFRWVHLCNSAALRNAFGQGATLIRPGLMLYGVSPIHPGTIETQASELDTLKLAPVLELKARVATVREMPAGHPVSYGATHHLTRPSRLATVLIGYGDGYPRRLSGQGHVLLRGHRALILGRVCMDQIVVDVTEITGVLPGDTAVCIGRQGDLRIGVEQIAALIDATPHEITTGLAVRLPRLYKEG